MTRSDDIGDRHDRSALAPVFAEDPVVGRDLAEVDWAATPLGPPAQWPQSLQTAVSILLSSRFSMWLAWGPELTFFCNDAYRRNTLGRKYPWALGRPAAEVWAEIWAEIKPRLDTVLATGHATWDEALRLFVERSGYPEESYHTFSYSPLRDERGAVAGMLCVVSEETDRVIGERRMATLRDLGSDPSVAREEQEVLAFACAQLGRNQRDLPFTLTYVFEDGHARLACATGIAAGHPAAPARVSPADDPVVWPAAAAKRGKSVVVELAAFTGLPRDRRPAAEPWSCRCNGRVASRTGSWWRASTGTARSTTATAGSSNWSRATSRPASRAPATSAPSSAAPRSWPSSTGPRRRSSPTSAMSSARRSR
ncbi:PAS domain-containing protein [Lentzea guizhouensis]|uniref:PAS domain-containing protein n=1 Tax=Lentzea guizhouensis TaxID=1586287 RepID=UPI001F3E87A6|nr:PAS domain-containing protein [Lentzea guizhouensis]